MENVTSERSARLECSDSSRGRRVVIVVRRAKKRREVCWARKVQELLSVMVEVVAFWVLRRILNNRPAEEKTFEYTPRSIWIPRYTPAMRAFVLRGALSTLSAQQSLQHGNGTEQPGLAQPLWILGSSTIALLDTECFTYANTVIHRCTTLVERATRFLSVLRPAT